MNCVLLSKFFDYIVIPGNFFNVGQTRAHTVGHYSKHSINIACYYGCAVRTVRRMYDKLNRSIPLAVIRCHLSSGASQHPRLSNMPTPDQV